MNRGLKEVKERTMLVPGRRAFQTEGTAHAKSLRQDQEHRSQCGWNRGLMERVIKKGRRTEKSWGYITGSGRLL